MPAVFICTACSVELTDFLNEEALSLYTQRIDGMLIPQGCFARVERPISRQDLYGLRFADRLEGELEIVQRGDFLVNVEDLRCEMHRDAQFGCCGYVGDFAPNASCPNRHPVATVHSDCWHSPFARLILGAVAAVYL